MKTDRELQEQVLAALEWDPGVNPARIGVSASDGVVTLQGAVTTFGQKWTAERVASHVFGVRAVANDLQVRPDIATTRTDSSIAQAVASALEWDSAVPCDAVRASVTSGWVTLTGTVEWQFEKMAAECAVRNLCGVKGVTNSIVVKPRARAQDVKTRIEHAFKRSAEIDAGRITIDAHNGSVTLTGIVRSLTERAEAERVAWAAPGVTTVDDRLVVEPVGVAPMSAGGQR